MEWWLINMSNQVELSIGWIIAGDYFRGKKGFVVDVLAALFMVGLSWLLTYTGSAIAYICNTNKIPEGVEGFTFDTEQCLAKNQWMLNWGEAFQTSFGMPPVMAAIAFYFLGKWVVYPLIRYITSQ